MMYDAAFRRQAYITGNRECSKVNPSLYSICFAGAACTRTRCELCLSLSHPTHECSLVNEDLDVSMQLKSLESAVLAFSAQAPQQQGRFRLQEVCRNWNAGRCRMPQCRYRHACRVCGALTLPIRVATDSWEKIPGPNFQPLGYPTPNEHNGGQGPYQQTQMQFGTRRPGPGPSDCSNRTRAGSQPY